MPLDKSSVKRIAVTQHLFTFAMLASFGFQLTILAQLGLLLDRLALMGQVISTALGIFLAIKSDPRLRDDNYLRLFFLLISYALFGTIHELVLIGRREALLTPGLFSFISILWAVLSAEACIPRVRGKRVLWHLEMEERNKHLNQAS